MMEKSAKSRSILSTAGAESPSSANADRNKEKQEASLKSAVEPSTPNRGKVDGSVDALARAQKIVIQQEALSASKKARRDGSDDALARARKIVQQQEALSSSKKAARKHVADKRNGGTPSGRKSTENKRSPHENYATIATHVVSDNEHAQEEKEGDVQKQRTTVNTAAQLRTVVQGTDGSGAASGGKERMALRREAKTKYNLGLVHLKSNDYDQAKVFFLASIEAHTKLRGATNPNIASAHEKLGNIFRDQGDTPTASNHYMQGLMSLSGYELGFQGVLPTHVVELRERLRDNIKTVSAMAVDANEDDTVDFGPRNETSCAPSEPQSSPEPISDVAVEANEVDTVDSGPFIETAYAPFKPLSSPKTISAEVFEASEDDSIDSRPFKETFCDRVEPPSSPDQETQALTSKESYERGMRRLSQGDYEGAKKLLLDSLVAPNGVDDDALSSGGLSSQSSLSSVALGDRSSVKQWSLCPAGVTVCSFFSHVLFGGAEHPEQNLNPKLVKVPSMQH